MRRSPSNATREVALLEHPSDAVPAWAATGARPRPRSRRGLPILAAVACMGFLLVSVAGPYSDSYAAESLAPEGGPSQAYAAGAGYDIDVTRDDYEAKAKPKPKPAAAGTSMGGAAPAAGTPDPGSAQAIAREMLAARGWGDDQFNCLSSLWAKESGWNVYAHNVSSGAYGIPQALPGSKMASVGSDWQTNPRTQITWGLQYIQGRYGTPCGAWAKSQASGWY
ncbi:lytic transglycosylase domain-containing protein [Homoserinibacter sp. YIM 151385]|uniref:aggregation-promoting factor C-terminal-like domain-containing protein n=1 Tax=Homoserinibacter sp. YIM 151385 TaxID=2985506 RepID=UPI0022F04424|nr:lytic transglycosylase domain-containing protein [Homoserinibacter sp. YIM 151385]WBU39158.1 lytic transglycosylase domain-containing protein [Homoserinibacter sp. YIM 151385]